MVRAEYEVTGVDEAFAEALAEVRAAVAEVGEEAVAYAVENGNYRNVTGRLRASNRYEVTERGDLVLENTAPYAAAVEARGKDVLASAALYAESLLKQRFGQ